MPVLLRNRIENDFKYHEPDKAKIKKHEFVRNTALNFAKDLVKMVPEGRELSLALTKLEEVVMWANAGIARNK